MNFYDFYTDALEKVAKNVPTSPEKWARAKAMARAKFDVYPSAYANGWAAKKYKEMGGGWKKEAELNKEAYLNAIIPAVRGLFTAGRALMATKKAKTALKAANTASNVATGVSAVRSVASAKPKPAPAPPSAG